MKFGSYVLWTHFNDFCLFPVLLLVLVNYFIICLSIDARHARIISPVFFDSMCLDFLVWSFFFFSWIKYLLTIQKAKELILMAVGNGKFVVFRWNLFLKNVYEKVWINCFLWKESELTVWLVIQETIAWVLCCKQISKDFLC